VSFLDNLENSLKSLENGTESDHPGREHARRRSDAAAQLAVAPWAEQLKKSPYTEELLNIATREGFKLKTKVYITWLGTHLRLEARDRRLEFHPAANGVQACFLVNGEETGSRLIDLQGDPAELVREWLA
jgi:hypothetical protein